MIPDHAQRISFSLVKGYRLLLFNLLGYALLIALSAWHLEWTTRPEVLQTELFNREADLPIVWTQIAVLAFLFLIYFAAVLNWQRLKISTRQLAGMIAAVTFLAWCCVPGVSSADPFQYIGFGRLAGVYHLNPYLHTYREVHDFYSPYAWFSFSMPYGPVVLLALIPAGLISSLNVLASLYFLKLEWVAVFFVSAWLLGKLLEVAGRDVGYGLFIFALNPLLLLELIVTGHNDGLVILFTLLALFFAQRQRMDVAIAMALLCALVKLSGIVLFGALVFLAVRNRLWKQSMIGLVGSGALVAGLTLTLLPNRNAWRLLTNQATVFNTNSAHGWLLYVMSPHVRSLYVSGPLTAPRLIVDGIFVLFCLWRLLRIKDFASLVRESAYMTIALLVIYSGVFFAWYLTWLLPYAALTESRRLRSGILLYTFTALWLYGIPIRWTADNLRLRAVRWALAHVPPLARLALPRRAGSG